MTSRGPFHLPEDIQSAHFCRAVPSFALRNGNRKGRKGEGLRYERKVQDVLTASSEWYLPSPWIIYVVAGRPYWCQPDGIYFDVASGRIVICEIKLSHTPDAHRQLRGVYWPCLQRMFPQPAWRVHLVEICKWYDPDVKFPEHTLMCKDPFDHNNSVIGVHILRP